MTRTISEPTTRRLFNGHLGWIWRLALSQDGKTLAGGGSGADPRIHLWSVETGEVRGVLEGHTDSVTGLAFSPDDKTLYSCSHDNTLREWDMEHLRQRGEPTLRSKQPFNHLALSQDGTLATGGDEKTLFLRNPGSHTFRCIERFEGQILRLALSSDGSILAVGMWDGHLKILSRQEDCRFQTLHSLQLDSIIWALTFTPEGELLCGTEGGQIHLVDVRTGVSRHRPELTVHTRGEIHALAFTRNSLLVGQCDTSVADGTRGSGRLHAVSWPDGALELALTDFWGWVNAVIPVNGGQSLLVSKNRTQSPAESPDRYAPCLLDFGCPDLGRHTILTPEARAAARW
ncbi:MAG: hypothetical protein AAB413_03160 [Patescibacteria group bacterium]